MENHICENCKYYVKYYTIYKGKRLLYADNGHCKHDKLMNRKIARERVQNKLPCDRWEQAESVDSVNKETLQNEIKEMKHRLDEIAILLK